MRMKAEKYAAHCPQQRIDYQADFSTRESGKGANMDTGLKKELETVSKLITQTIAEDTFPSGISPECLASAVRAYPIHGGKRIRPALLLWSCGTGQNDGHDHPHEAVHEENSHLETAHENEDAHAEEAHAHSDEIVISPEKAEAAGIAVETVEFRNFASVIRTGGQILPALGDEKIMVASTDGVIAFGGNYFEGSKVDAGQPLFSILSGNIQDGNRIGKTAEPVRSSGGISPFSQATCSRHGHSPCFCAPRRRGFRRNLC